MILHLKLDTSALAGYQHASKDTALDPDLASFTNNKTLWCGPRVKIEATTLSPSGIDAARISLQNIYGTLVCNKPVLVFPGDANRGADLVSYPGETVSEIDGRRGGRWERETKEEGCKSAPGAMVVRW